MLFGRASARLRATTPAVASRAWPRSGLSAAGARVVVANGTNNFQRSAMRWSTVAAFHDVSFHYRETQPILEETSFSIKAGSKVTIMGQNGAGKSTIIKMLAGDAQASSGLVTVNPGERVSVAKQTMSPECRAMNLTEFFGSQFKNDREHPGPKLPGLVHKVLKEVGLDPAVSSDRLVSSFSGGQQARLLLAAALISEPSILLLDEPTNNLDAAGVARLREFIESTDKTCLVISHDEDFLNSFTDSVLYLDIFSKAVESYDGDYWYVKEEITKRIARENQQNSRLARDAQKKKDQANVFANKGGRLRFAAKKMREAASKMEDEVVDVRKEDVTLRPFELDFTPALAHGPLVRIDAVTTRHPLTGEPGKLTRLPVPQMLFKGGRLHIRGRNGIGKTTFLELLSRGAADLVDVAPGALIGYYRQDFNNFDFAETGLFHLKQAASQHDATEEDIRRTAARFLLRGNVVYQPVRTLSEGQKALLSLACLKLLRPSILIMDEPTNHVNFRHLPAIAKALSTFEGALILVSHDEHMVNDVDCSQTIDLDVTLDPKNRHPSQKK